MKPGLISTVLFITLGIEAQITLPDSILTEIQNNIIVFRIRNFYDLGVSKYHTIDLVKPRFSQILLKPKESLILDYKEKDNLFYPIDGFQIFLVQNPSHSKRIGNIVPAQQPMILT